MKSNNWILLAAFSAMTVVAMGAFGAHALKHILDDYGQSIYAKAVLYQMFHTIGIFLVGILIFVYNKPSLNISGILFTLGIVLFSGSLYVLAITGMRWLAMFTPLGGISFIAGWGWIIYQMNRNG